MSKPPDGGPAIWPAFP